MTKTKTTSTSKSYDKAVYFILRITLIAMPLLVLLILLFQVNMYLAMALVASGFVVCTAIILVKGAMTGKRYAQGAKKRRSKWLSPFFKKDEGLEDEIFRYLWDKEKR